MEERLQKIFTERGICSRRQAEALIEEGRVAVNGQPAHLGMKADPDVDFIKLDGKLISKPENKVYIAMYKPRNVITSLSDPEDRPTVASLLGKVKQRVYPVGRLDFDSEGLLLLTNDGEFTNLLLQPAHKVPKTYQVKVKGKIDNKAIEKLRTGIKLDGRRTAPAKVKRTTTSATEANSWIEITITEGRKRQIRRMLETLGYLVIKLKRTRIGPFSIGDLKPGEMRYIDTEEVHKFLKSIKSRNTEKSTEKTGKRKGD